MRLRPLAEKIALVALALSPSVAMSLDAPHDRIGSSGSACYACHKMYTPTVGGSSDFNAACVPCHNLGGRIAWQPENVAVPGVQGSIHSWFGPATSPAYGAAPKLGAADLKLLVDGNLQCAVCHDPHTTAVAVKPGSMSVSVETDQPLTKSGTAVSPGGSATMTLAVDAGTAAKAFRVRLRTVVPGAGATPGTGTFIISHDYAWNAANWMNWSDTASAWVAGAVDGQGYPFTDGVEVPLDIAGARVTISGGGQPGDYWDFFVAYPYLRLSNVNDAQCYMCHQERVMNHTRVRGDDRTYLPNGVRRFSHPVGQKLNANLLGTDRTTALDADGTVGSSGGDAGDGQANTTNDLVMDGGVVTCTTCHAVHNADSNSLTRDAR